MQDQMLKNQALQSIIQYVFQVRMALAFAEGYLSIENKCTLCKILFSM